MQWAEKENLVSKPIAKIFSFVSLPHSRIEAETIPVGLNEA